MKRFKYGLSGLLMALGLTAALPAVADEVVAYAAGGWFAVDSRAVKDTTLSGGAIVGGETNLVLQCSPSAWGAVSGGSGVTVAYSNATSGAVGTIAAQTAEPTLDWTPPAEKGTYELTHQPVDASGNPLGTAQIAKFEVEVPVVPILARPTAVDNTTAEVYTNGVLSAETVPDSGLWYAWSNETAVVVYTARDGFAWEGGVTVVTNELDTTKDPAWNEDYPSKPSPLPMAAAYRYPSYNVEGDPKSGIKEWHDGVTNAIDLAKMIDDPFFTTELYDGWYVVTNSIECARIYCGGHVHLILADGCELRVTEGILLPWLDYESDVYSLDVYAQEAGTGKLISTGTDVAGIGGTSTVWGGNVTINGGILDVSSVGGAGIGGWGNYGEEGVGCTNIVINGGEITATGGGFSAGIGGAGMGVCKDVVINGGVVFAQGSNGGAGIGGGWFGTASGIMINGGTVTAAGGVFPYGGGGLGSAIGNGSNYEEYVPEPATNIFVAGGLLVKAGDDNPPTTMIGHDDTTDLAGVAEFAGKQYATIQPKKSIVAQLKTVYYTTAEVYTNGVLSSEISTGKWAAWSNEPAYVVYTAVEDYVFTNGQTAVTNMIDTSKNPAVAPSADEPVHMPWVAEADGRKFTTLKKAYDSVADAEIGTTIRLLADITATEPFVIEKNIKLDLNGYDYNGPAAGSFTAVGHTLKVVGTNTVSGALAMMDGEIILYGGTYDTNVNGLEADICEVTGSGPWTVVAKTGEQGGLVVKDKDEEKQGEVTVSYETLSEEGLSTNDLNTVGKNGLMVWESLSLGVDANDASSLPLAKATQQLDASKLVVSVMEVGESKIPEAGVAYQLYGSSNKVDWVECGEPSATPDIEATRDPVSGQFYRYYRIESKITITPAVPMVTVTFVDTQERVTVPSQTISKGSTADDPRELDPEITNTDDGHVLVRWRLGDPDDGEEFEFSTPVDEDITLYAVWSKE